MKQQLLLMILLLCVPPLAFGLALVVISLPPGILRLIGPQLEALVYLAFWGRIVSLVTWPIGAVVFGFGWKAFSRRDRIYGIATLAVAAIPVGIIVDAGW